MKLRSVLSAAVLTAGLCVAQGQQGPTPLPDQVAAQAQKEKGVYGTIKEMKAGDKLVLSVDNGKDRSYKLSDPKRTISLAEGLAVGDKIKIIESGKKGDRSIQIVRDVRDQAGQTGERARTGNDQQK